MQNRNSFFQVMEFHISAAVRQKCGFQKKLFSSTGNVILSDVRSLYEFTAQYNAAVKQGNFGTPVHCEQYLTAGQLYAMGLIDEIFHYMCRLYRRDIQASFFSTGYSIIAELLAKKVLPPLERLLLEFCIEFPSAAVYSGAKTAAQWFSETDAASGIEHKLLAFEECLLCKLANDNPAFKPFKPLFNDTRLAQNPSYTVWWDAVQAWAKENPPFGTENTDIISVLKAPVVYSPHSLKGQLEYIRTHWLHLLGNLGARLLTALDIIAEEEKAGWNGCNGTDPLAGYNMDAYHFEQLTTEYERFSTDSDWMPHVVMMAKSTLVWLDQLSKKYRRPITRLDHIPDEELNFLAEAGFNALWLIGVWERSAGSGRIKQICGNPEAAASAYSLMDYDIAESLGGWDALAQLRCRAEQRGIRLAADMVPNHTGIDSRWIVEHPDLFVQTRDNPFPSYTFDGENLAHDSRIGVYLENHYYSKTDCAVVFKRIDHDTGEVRYIYHGNDGTGLPWNDTAQIDFLNPHAREAVIQKILHVARNFPIIRFDAAMVLAKKHIRRLWYPEPGHGGDIASRSRYALSTEEFQKRLPEEFWREVVDRCEVEVPNTLLLAEAFWMMEGYFVRTLGMHRVYNSAFMNMLKREENEKYRLTIKNTLEFDPQILKRYVNFMNNPDEETAVAQFGKDDKYFGVCTMLVAMPGLPMFGHGQLEGFSEKYGMEYRRAYYDEQVNQGLIDRHRYEIFPLMKNRRIFSDVENFLLYDFWANNTVNENVFAWSNACGDSKALILYNNKYEQAAGWIRVSAAYAVKDNAGNKQLVQQTLAHGLGILGQDGRYVLMQEQHSKLWFIRESNRIAQDGLFAALNGFETQVYMNITEVTDTADGIYGTLYKQLNGSGIADISTAVNELRFKELYAATEQMLSEKFLSSLKKVAYNHEAIYAEIQNNTCNARIAAYIAALDKEYRRFTVIFPEYAIKKGKRPPINKLTSLYINRLKRLLLCLCKAVNTQDCNGTAPNITGSLLSIIRPEAAAELAAVLLLFAIEDLCTHYAAKPAIRSFLGYTALTEKAAAILRNIGMEQSGTIRLLNTAMILPVIHAATGAKKVRRKYIIEALVRDKTVSRAVGLHNRDGISWFHCESAVQYAANAVTLLFLASGGTIPKKDSLVTKLDKDIKRYDRLADTVQSAIHTSGYRLDEFTALFTGSIKNAGTQRSTIAKGRKNT